VESTIGLILTKEPLKKENPPKADKYRISKEFMLSILLENRAQRFHPSTFDIRYSAFLFFQL
jgi:hypothetical protein